MRQVMNKRLRDSQAKSLTSCGAMLQSFKQTIHSIIWNIY